MIALCFLLAGLLATAIGVNIWSVRGWVAETKSSAKSEIGSTHFESALELAHFELETTRRALSATEKRAQALEEIIAEDDLNAHENADLGRTDVRGRLLRAAQAWRAADADRVPAEPAVPMHPEEGPGPGAEAAGLRTDPAADVHR